MGLLDLTPQQYQGIAALGSGIARSAQQGRPWDINAGMDAMRTTYAQAMEKKRLEEQSIREAKIEKAKNELDAWYKQLQGKNIQEQILQRQLENKNLPTKIQLENDKTNQEVNKLIAENNIFNTRHKSQILNRPVMPDGTTNNAYVQAQKDINFAQNPNYMPGKADAGRAAMLDTATNAVRGIKESLLTPDGKLKEDANSLIRGAQMIGVSDWLSPIAAKGSGTLANNIEVAIQSVTRIETGAAMQPSELANTRMRFQPKIQDDENTRRQKILALELFVNNAGKYIVGDSKGVIVDAEKAMSDAKIMMQIQAEKKRRGL